MGIEDERCRKIASAGRAIVICQFGKAWVLAWQAGAYLREFMLEQGACEQGFDPEREGFDVSIPTEAGVWICDLTWVDDGPSDWGDGSRETLPSMSNWRLATETEWDHHLSGEWPWVPEKGWT